ncbi:hypothetical protein ACFP1Z_16755 [Streptomyces gamaensis]|uniref:Uncharacterized protein n=1 Tax=Streptomyces gamaensis TaxID=1763542 RepID=A0ABW0Z417_9ACTN
MTAPRPVVPVPHTSGPSVLVPGETDCPECVRLTAARHTATARCDWPSEARYREQTRAHWAAAHNRRSSAQPQRRPS